MGTGITGLLCTIALLDDVITYFWNVSKKHCKRFFEVIMEVIIKEDSKERNYIGLNGNHFELEQVSNVYCVH